MKLQYHSANYLHLSELLHEKNSGNQDLVFGKSAKKGLLKFNKFIKNNKIIIYKSNGKYLYNQRKSNLQYHMSPNCPSEYLLTPVLFFFLIPRFEVYSK